MIKHLVTQKSAAILFDEMQKSCKTNAQRPECEFLLWKMMTHQHSALEAVPLYVYQ